MIKKRLYDLDTSGLLCPLPLAKAKQQLKHLAPGEVLRVISTDPSSVLDFKVFAETSGHELVKLERHHQQYLFWIKKR